MFFPEEVLIQVLVRLPPKSLSRFKCVSKAWHAMIDSHQFMAEYLQLTYTGYSGNHFLHLISQKSSHLPMTLISLLFSESEDECSQLLELKGAPGITELFGDVSDPKVNTWYSHSVSSPINGMYCVNIIQYNPPHLQNQARLVRTAFYNPGVGQFHILPSIPRPAMLDVFMDLQGREWDVNDGVDVQTLEAFLCGFVYDRVSQDYKLFCISQYGDNYRGPYFFVCFHLYSLASDSWEELHLSQIAYPPDLVAVQRDDLSYFSPHPLIDDGIAVPLNGSCHWLCSDMEQTHIISFDIVNRAFDETSFPLRMFGYNAMLTIMDGYLAIAGPPPTTVDFESDTSMIDVSVMKEYGVKESWMKAYRITLKSPGRCLGIIKDKLFVQEEDDGWVVSYRLGADQDYHRYGHVPFDKFDIRPLEGSLIPIHPINE